MAPTFEAFALSPIAILLVPSARLKEPIANEFALIACASTPKAEEAEPEALVSVPPWLPAPTAVALLASAFASFPSANEPLPVEDEPEPMVIELCPEAVLL